MKERLQPKDVIIPSLTLLALYFLLTGAFSREVAHQIKERDKRCVQCGSSRKLEASHKDHTRNEWYNDPETGETLCSGCHYDYHHSYRGRAYVIGLTEDSNEYAIKSLWNRMSKYDKAGRMPPHVILTKLRRSAA